MDAKALLRRSPIDIVDGSTSPSHEEEEETVDDDVGHVGQVGQSTAVEDGTFAIAAPVLTDDEEDDTAGTIGGVSVTT